MLKKIAESHIDHGLSDAQLSYILEACGDMTGFEIRSLTLPEGLGEVPCALYGPLVGDSPVTEAEVSYIVREGRRCASRVVKREPRPTRTVTVIAGPAAGEPCVLYTAFGGPLAPREPGDTTLPVDKVQESRDFWAQHALATGEV